MKASGLRLAVMLVGFAAWAAEPTTPPTAAELLDKYGLALDSTRSFISTSESSSRLTCRVPSWGLEMRDAQSSERSEERTDGRGQLYGKSLRWGYVSASEKHLTQANARYNLNVVGDGFRYRDDKALGQARFKGHVDYQVKGVEEYEKYRATWGYFNGDTVLGHLL